MADLEGTGSDQCYQLHSGTLEFWASEHVAHSRWSRNICLNEWVLPLPSCVTLGKLCNSSFSLQSTVDRIYSVAIWEVKINMTDPLQESLSERKFSHKEFKGICCSRIPQWQSRSWGHRPHLQGTGPSWHHLWSSNHEYWEQPRRGKIQPQYLVKSQSLD